MYNLMRVFVGFARASQRVNELQTLAAHIVMVINTQWPTMEMTRARRTRTLQGYIDTL